jgi:hypothetical protein
MTSQLGKTITTTASTTAATGSSTTIILPAHLVFHTPPQALHTPAAAGSWVTTSLRTRSLSGSREAGGEGGGDGEDLGCVLGVHWVQQVGKTLGRYC